jgi:hypothetical protein
VASPPISVDPRAGVKLMLKGIGWRIVGLAWQWPIWLALVAVAIWWRSGRSMTVLLFYCLLHAFTYFEANQAMELAREDNPNFRPLKLMSGAGMLVEYGFPLYYAIAVGPWYWGLMLLLVGFLAAAIAFNLLQAWGTAKLRLAVVLGGFLAIPACIVALVLSAFRT